MRLRSDWQTTKAAAKKANNNVEVKFPAKADLGPLLDKYATAQKAYAKAKGNEHNAAWAKTAAAYFAAAVVVGSAALTYQQSLEKLAIAEPARDKLHTHLAYKIIDEMVNP